jgi:hypothetical protein
MNIEAYLAFLSPMFHSPRNLKRPRAWESVQTREHSFPHARRHCGQQAVHMSNVLPEWAKRAAASHGTNSTPHAGSHFTRRDRGGRGRGRFFEGWFLRAVLPGDEPLAFAFMISIEEAASGGRRQVICQVLGPDEKLLVRKFDREDRMWYASANSLALGNWEASTSAAGRPRPLTGSSFSQAVLSGFQLTASNCSGRMFCSDSESPFVAWSLDMVPLVSWGTRGKKGRCTATWLSHFPVFEPGYQVRAFLHSLPRHACPAK